MKFKRELIGAGITIILLMAVTAVFGAWSYDGSGLTFTFHLSNSAAVENMPKLGWFYGCYGENDTIATGSPLVDCVEKNVIDMCFKEPIKAFDRNEVLRNITYTSVEVS